VGIYISYLRAGFWGAWAGGWAFIFPNFVIVAGLGALYVHLGDLKPVTAVFYGVSPAVIALILYSCYRLGKLGMEDRFQWVIAGVCLVITVVLKAEVALLFIGAGIAGILYYGQLFRTSPPAPLQIAALPAVAQLVPVSTSGLTKLFLFFLKAGALTFGSGLVIVPFLEQGLVREYNWLDERQFLIAVAVGMLSPGPVVITATFVGYLVGGFWGSVVSTIGIFLPSFLLVLIAAPLLAKHGDNRNVRVREGRLRRGHWNDPRRLHSPRSHSHRRLAHCRYSCGVPRSFIPLESEQSATHRGHRRDRTDRVPAAATDVGDGQVKECVRKEFCCDLQHEAARL
jgi:chromate transporter